MWPYYGGQEGSSGQRRLPRPTSSIPGAQEAKVDVSDCAQCRGQGGAESNHYCRLHCTRLSRARDQQSVPALQPNPKIKLQFLKHKVIYLFNYALSNNFFVWIFNFHTTVNYLKTVNVIFVNLLSQVQPFATRDPKECSMPGFPVLHHLPKLTQTHVH